ncbi:MAG: HNH endonuclease [Blastochloris viridis]|uniref:HNH endonuclease n=1 Tax=Blastochloris viridis TaxID=1079 RepID=A0A6N4RBI0_BLAVI|nr:MAG: HNH endonuclease [Blastochloris viridis]
MSMVDINDFLREEVYTYKGETYSVRDNGAVMRHPLNVAKPRPTDLKWVFGKPNIKHGYLEIAAVRVHRIVALAFLGEPETPEHVVDHIDTNRHNNRPENLRWLTRLENVLNNPITLKRVELVCGSVERFLANPSLLGASTLDTNFSWMRTVTREEAQASLERLQAWASKRDTSRSDFKGQLGEWVFQPPLKVQGFSNYHNGYAYSDLTESLTAGAVQRKWRVPAEFPCCPLIGQDVSLTAYAQKLAVGAVFAQTHFSESKVVEVVISQDETSLWVLCAQGEGAVKPWSLAQITCENGLYVHTSLGTFFHKDGAEKQLHLAQGLEWTGGDTFDDYC